MRYATYLATALLSLTASPSLVEYDIPTPNSAPHKAAASG